MKHAAHHPNIRPTKNVIVRLGISKMIFETIVIALSTLSFILGLVSKIFSSF